LTNWHIGTNYFKITDNCGLVNELEVDFTCPRGQEGWFPVNRPVCCEFQYDHLISNPSNNTANGSILIEMGAGTCNTTATITWLHNGSNEFEQYGLSAGIYEAILKNEFCETTITFDLGNCNTSNVKTIEYISASGVSCSQLSGSKITINVKAILEDEDVDNGNFDNKLVNNGQIIRFRNDFSISSKGRSILFSGLPDGNYELYFRDDNSCSWDLAHNWKFGC